MPIIKIETKIKSDINICFDLSRSIDLHKISTEDTNEEAIDGKTFGLIGLNEFVTWEATHFGIKQRLTSKITEYKRPIHFRDEQTKGVFELIIHDHFFETLNDNTVLMKDVFEYKSPYGIFGKFFNKLVLTKYMTNLLVKRSNIIKEYAETDKWRIIINE